MVLNFADNLTHPVQARVRTLHCTSPMVTFHHPTISDYDYSSLTIRMRREVSASALTDELPLTSLAASLSFPTRSNFEKKFRMFPFVKNFVSDNPT